MSAVRTSHQPFTANAMAMTIERRKATFDGFRCAASSVMGINSSTGYALARAPTTRAVLAATASVDPSDHLRLRAHVVDAAISPTPAEAHALAVILAPIECKPGINDSPTVTTTGAVHVDPRSCKLRVAIPAPTTVITASIAENTRAIPKTPSGVGSTRATAVATATSK